MKDENCKQAQSQETTCNTAERLKEFEECGIEEKVQRLYVTIRDLRHTLHYLHEANMQLSTKLYALEHHQHSEKGDCMIRIEDTNRGGGASIGGLGISNHDLLA